MNVSNSKKEKSYHLHFTDITKMIIMEEDEDDESHYFQKCKNSIMQNNGENLNESTNKLSKTKLK